MLSERIDEIKELFYREDCNLLFNPKNQNISKLKNSTALDFYLAIMNNNSVQDIVNSLVEKYSVDSEIVLRDLSNFTNSILQVSNHNVYRVNKGYNNLNFPLAVELEITSKCNWKCSFCYNTWLDDINFKGMELSFEEIKRILEECYKNQCTTIRYSGGEPFLHKEFFRILEYSALLKMNNIVFTNGSFIKTPEIVEKLQKRNVKQILLSYHGDKITHETLTGVPNSYDSTILAIQLLSDSAIKLTVEVTLTKSNYNMIRHILNKLIALNVKDISIMRYVCTGRNDSDNEVSYEEFKRVIDICNNIVEKDNNINISFPCSQRLCLSEKPIMIEKSEDRVEMQKGMLLGNCESGFNWCSIAVNGEIRICPHSKTYFGSVSKGIKETWDVMKKKVLEEINKSNCKSCYYFTNCLGGCYLDKFI